MGLTLLQKSILGLISRKALGFIGRAGTLKAFEQCGYFGALIWAHGTHFPLRSLCAFNCLIAVYGGGDRSQLHQVTGPGPGGVPKHQQGLEKNRLASLPWKTRTLRADCPHLTSWGVISTLRILLACYCLAQAELGHALRQKVRESIRNAITME